MTMEIFTVRFLGGVLLTGLGLLSLVIGIISLLPSEHHAIIGIILVVIGVTLIRFGRKTAKNAPPSGTRTAVDTLRKAKLLDKK